MSAVRDAAHALATALSTVDGVRVYTDPSATVDPPGLVIGPPSLSFEAFCPDPTSAAFMVYIVTAGDGRAVERLWDLVRLVAGAVEAHTPGAVTSATPGSWGTPELPAYVLRIEVPL